ncbi:MULTISPECIES: RNase A-like domain-containing protein [Achromobacter]|uniref:Bacterial CdiA-CT RNAse A domain-containing protein n=1 Tax=Achromobacter spanius TaxID=217203 RepID=A0ABY8GML2_9BURK|nr:MULTISPECIES: RNase A-like domain-containing protein [Achromobacter]WAI84905.1 hypothetical protein N8Z00_07460 [Achromobacter spanius]WEX94989.1 hypothetical protein N3Z32_02055 [Achromobacter sp. SS2-2022]WFP05843.1 hypothetical protein P8T11_16030 [Achromobacter spanius]
MKSVTAGVGAAFNGANFFASDAEIANAARGSLGVTQSVARAAVSSTVSQGIAVATGLQSRFNWTNVAAAGIGAGVGSAVSSTVLPNATVFGERMTRGFVAGAVGGVAATVLSGGKADYVRIATDAFGNALGNAVVDAMQDESSPPSTDRRRSGQGIRISEQDLAAFVRDPLSMDDGGLPLARLRAGLPVNGSESPTYTSGESENDLYSALVRVMSEDKPRHQGVLLADNGGNNSAAALEALALARKGVAPNESWGGKGSFFYGLKEGRANRSVMDTEPVSMAEKLGALTRDFVVGAKDALVEMPLMAVDTARLTGLAATAVMTGRAEEFQPWSDTGKFAKAGGTLGEYYGAPFSALENTLESIFQGKFEAASSGAAVLLGGVLGGRASRPTALNISPAAFGGDTAFSRIVIGGGLQAHENVGGHLLLKHVGQTESSLLSRLGQEPRISASSSFYTRAVAEDVVSKVLESNHTKISEWVSGRRNRLILEYNPASSTEFVGISVVRGTEKALDVSNARVVLQRNSSMPFGYNVLTGFPVSR